MNARFIEVFCCVYEEKSFSAAARKLDLSQPTISGHIKSLEQSLGTRLFDRLGRQIEVTSAGELLYGYARQIVELKKNAEEAMARFLNRLEGDLHLGASSVPGECILPSVIGRFRELHPKVHISLEIGDTEDVIRGVLAGKVEVGFVGSKVSRQGLEFRKFDSDKLTFVVPCTRQWSHLGEVINLVEWLRLPLLVREKSSGSRTMLEQRLRELDLEIDRLGIVAELGSTTAILEAVRSGLGASVLSSLSVQTDLENGRVRAVEVEGLGPLARDFFSVHHRDRTSSPLAEAFLEHLVKEPALAPGDTIEAVAIEAEASGAGTAETMAKSLELHRSDTAPLGRVAEPTIESALPRLFSSPPMEPVSLPRRALRGPHPRPD